MRRIGSDHFEERRLVGILETKLQTKTVGKREPVIGNIARIDRGIFLVLSPFDNVASVRRDIKPDIGWTCFGTTLKHRAQAARPAIVAFECHIVDKQDETPVRLAKQGEQLRQARQLI